MAQKGMKEKGKEKKVTQEKKTRGNLLQLAPGILHAQGFEGSYLSHSVTTEVVSSCQY